jgi:competence protein ComEA
MDQETTSRYLSLIKKHWLTLSLGLLGLMFFAYGLIGLFFSNKSASESIVFESSAEQNSSSESKTILVDVEGSVVNPGVYRLPGDSRIQDGLSAAGGLSASADRDFVAKNFNLAIKLQDGSKIYVPEKGGAVNAASVLNITVQNAAVSSLININSASESELDSLSGVGPVTAQKIISGRPYNSINELLDKKIVSSKVFNQIKDKITIY